MVPQLPEDDNAEITDINVTPLVDVTLVLLIIFMVTASLVFTRALPVKLPRAESSEPAPQVSWQLVMRKDGAYFLNGGNISSRELASRMRSEVLVNPGLRIEVAADEGISYGSVITALDVLKKQGVKNVVLSVNP